MSDSPDKDSKRFQPIPGYEILSRIGSGGMGTIYKARQVSMNRTVALKILKKKDITDPLPLDRMRREALLIARMDHTHIVKGIDMGETNRYYFFAMEFIEGRSVKSLLDLFGPMNELQAANIIRDVAEALQYAFEHKLTHRDVKPGNILISEAGHTKLTDLGLAKAESDLTLTREGTTLGTPQYISPEQARTPKAVDIRSDIYSLGATFYHMVSGSMAFEGETMAQVLTKVLFERPVLPEKLNPSIQRATSRVISRMMAKNPAHRYQTPAELLMDLRGLIEILEGRLDEASQNLGMTWKKSQRARWVVPVSISAGVVFLAILVALTGYMLSREEVREVKPDPRNNPLTVLQQEYDSREIDPSAALKGLGSIPILGPGDRESIDAFRERVQADCRQMMENLLDPSSSRFDRALAEGGIANASNRLNTIASRDATQVLGIDPEGLPPTLALYWEEKLREAKALLETRIEACNRFIAAHADELLAKDVELFHSLCGKYDFKEAYALLNRLRFNAKDLFRQAALAYLEGLDTQDVTLTLDPDRFMEKGNVDRFTEKVSSTASELEQELKASAEKAQAAYLEAVRKKTVDKIRRADLVELQSGIEPLMAKAAAEVDVPAPILPTEGGMRFADLVSIEPALTDLCASTIEERNEEKGREAGNALFRKIDDALGQRDYALALERIASADSEAVQFDDFGRRWQKNIKLLKALESGALEALKAHVGLDCRLKTRRGVIYEGEIRSVNLEAKEIASQLQSGQVVTLKLDDLSLSDILHWSERVRVLNPTSKALFLYYNESFEDAIPFFMEAEDLKEAEFYLDLIDKRKEYEALAREKEARAIRVLLDEAEQALKEKNWEEGFELLDTCRSFYRSTPGWNETRRRRMDLEKGLENLKEQSRRSSRLERQFSVPITFLNEDTIRLQYDFSSKRELDDFTSHGQSWGIKEGALVCGTIPASGKADHYHNRVGVRFGETFDIQEDLSLYIEYEPPFEGTGPEFFGIWFFGGCFGVRTFPEGTQPGQINFWNGDLEEYADYFFVPEFGETRPRKGRSLPFGFRRGEKYVIGIEWISGGELLFSVDEVEIYRSRSFKPIKGAGIEIRTFREAVIESLVLEGKIKD